jgi:hypothetical protein
MVDNLHHTRSSADHDAIGVLQAARDDNRRAAMPCSDDA